MKSFKEFITELFDAPVKVTKVKNGTSHRHDYSFKVNNVPYQVSIHHMFAKKGMADVDFGDKTEKPEDSMATTGKQGSHASQVFAAVHKALRMHQAENPHIDTYSFDASYEKSGDVNPARTKLYGAMVRRAGGKQFGNSFKIPASALKEEAEEPYAPKKTIKAYKLFRTKKNAPGKLFPLFVNADKEVPQGEWLKAEAGPQAEGDATKVSSKLGKLAYRPGWHSGDLPIATHIGGKSKKELKKPDYRPSNHVWAEVEHPDDHDWQSVADSRMQKNKKGEGIQNTAHITDEIPFHGHYRYKTNPNMTGNWIISGHMKVNRILSDDEVKSINDKAGVADLPRNPEAEAAKKPKKNKVQE